MHIVDLSHPITANIPVWPGTPKPAFTDLCSIGRNGFGERWLQLSSHTGTHIDAPAHLIEGAASLDKLPVDTFFGSGVVLDLREVCRETLSLDLLLASRSLIEQARFLLLHTGWSRFWGDASYNHGYPVLSPEAAGWLAGVGLRGIGVDAPSFDTCGSEVLPVHHCLLGSGLILIENLTALDRIEEHGFLLSIFPLGITGAEACPVRAIAIMPSFL
jgi:kynurenine formamidase